VWLLAAIVVLLFQGTIMARMKISDPAGLWLALPVLLFTVWLPMFYGCCKASKTFSGWAGV